VQKNVVLNGFDSSTENIAFFEVLYQKKEVAPFKVKKCFLLVREEKNCDISDDCLYSYELPCGSGGVKRYAMAILFHALMVTTAAVRNGSSFSSNSFCTSA